MTATDQLLFQGADWDFRTLQKICDTCEQVACGREQEGLGGIRWLARRGLVNAHVDFLPQVRDLVMIAPIAIQETHQGLFVRQHFTREPCIDRFSHHAILGYGQQVVEWGNASNDSSCR